MFTKKESPYSYGIIFFSLFLSLCISFFLAILLAILFYFFQVDHIFLGGLLMAINYLAIFLGGVLTGRKTGQHGWLNGGLLGLAYMMILLFLGQILLSIDFSSMVVLRLITGLLCGGLGGILGVYNGE